MNLYERVIMKTSVRCLLLLVAVAMLAPPLAAHHGRGQSFDMKQRVTLEGVVSEVKWQNPHVLIFIDVKDDTGKVVNWAFENSNVHTLATQGYNRNTLRVGQAVTAIVNPAVNGSPLGIIVKVILADGSEIMSRERGNPVD
jgi:aspartyl-tRNA synthetase